ncbi:hypothetical protein EJB05_56145 [Eragrostis curvula]|uniref:Uncharacterized protein n=1 Tax=Eragrostis curvula TaxID=38414 RepID=A0A5J9SI43_9POAL|nr:hypothetical protein EJB05_56145 [Eragrostis curvula]
MITRSKLVEQLRDYQIRSQHKRDIIGAISWGLLCCFLIISSYMTLYFRHFWLSAVIISLGILLPAGLYIFRQRKLAKKRERRLLLPLSIPKKDIIMSDCLGYLGSPVDVWFY